MDLNFYRIQVSYKHEKIDIKTKINYSTTSDVIKIIHLSNCFLHKNY